MSEVARNDLILNNSTYKITFKNNDRMILQKYTVTSFIKMLFDDFVREKNLDIVNYFTDYQKENNIHILAFDVREDPKTVTIEEIVNYIIENANPHSNIDLVYKKAEIVNKSSTDYKNEEQQSYFDKLDIDLSADAKQILTLTAIIYSLSIIKDFTE